MDERPYRVSVGRLFEELYHEKVPAEWILESWEEYTTRLESSSEGLRETMRVQWKATKNGGTISGSLFFNESLLVEAGPKWMADALADLVRENIANPDVQPVREA